VIHEMLSESLKQVVPFLLYELQEIIKEKTIPEAQCVVISTQKRIGWLFPPRKEILKLGVKIMNNFLRTCQLKWSRKTHQIFRVSN